MHGACRVDRATFQRGPLEAIEAGEVRGSGDALIRKRRWIIEVADGAPVTRALPRVLNATDRGWRLRRGGINPIAARWSGRLLEWGRCLAEQKTDGVG